jgi:tetratricopeptide (TPR) repeat protein
MAECLNILCSIAEKRSNYDLLNQLVIQNLDLRRQIGDRDGEIGCLGWAAWEAFRQQDYEKAEAMNWECYLSYKGLDLQNGMFLSLTSVGEMAWRRGKPQQAIAFYDQALQILPQRGDITFDTDLQLLKARVALSQGNYDQALEWIHDSLATGRRLHQVDWVATALVELGRHSLATRQYDQAQHLYDEALSFSREVDHKLCVALACCGLGKAALAQGDLVAAKSYLLEGFSYFHHEVAHIYSVGLSLQCVIDMAIEQKMTVQAVHLLAACEALLTGYENMILPVERGQHEESLAAVRTALGDEAFAAAWTEGQAMTMEQMLDLALEVLKG